MFTITYLINTDFSRLALSAVMSQQSEAQALKTSLADAGLVPGAAASLIPEDLSPSTQLTVKFGERLVELGAFFRASECKTEPSLGFTPEVMWTSPHI